MNTAGFDGKPVREINIAFLRAAFGFGLAWVSWQLYAPEAFLFGLIAAAAAIGATKRLIEGLWKTWRLMARERKLARYRRQGGAPKADTLADEDDLRARGLIE